MACKDQMEDYLIVYEKDDSLQSQKRKKSFIIPTGFHLDCKDSTPSQNEQEKAGERKDEMDNFINSNKSLCGERLSNVESAQKPQSMMNTEVTDLSLSAVNATKLFANSGYIDMQRPTDYVQEGDYSQVKQMMEKNLLILDKENILMDSSGIQRTEKDVPDDYSRVKEVAGDSLVLL